MSALTLHAPAKVNLQLRVLGRRADGYHLLRMIMVPLTVGDTIVVSDEAPSSSAAHWYRHDGINLCCEHSPIPLDANHLCVRAAAAMREASGRRDATITMCLTKRIPVAAGLGGGSSDAAAVLRALNTLWNLHWEPQALAEIGLRLGADVPFFCWGGPAVVEGIGERVTPLTKFPVIPMLLINPNVPVATAEVYRRFASAFCLTDPPPDASAPPIFERFEDVTACLANDLEPITTALVPILATLRDRLRKNGAEAVLMSGSGPTMFGLFRTMAARDAALESLRGTGWWVCATETQSVPGV